MERVSGLQVKKVNGSRIFQLVYQSGPISRQSIANELGMSMPTVTHNLKRLKEAGLILDDVAFESTGGRKAKGISLDLAARTAIGIDITKNHAVFVAINIKAEIIGHTMIRLPFENEPAYFEILGRETDNFIKRNGIDVDRLLGVGISLPCLLTADNQTVEYASVIDFSGGRLEQFSQFIPYHCLLCNDSSAAGVAELWDSQGGENMIYLSLSNSVGGAILLNNTFYPGENHKSAEFGHTTIVPEGRQCYCGQKGCVDAYCAAHLLSDTAGGSLSVFFELVKANSPNHRMVWEEYLEYLALTINNLRMSFGCRVVLGGYVGAMLDDHIQELRNRVSVRNSFESGADYLEVCRYKRASSAVGAALHHVKTFVDSI